MNLTSRFRRTSHARGLDQPGAGTPVHLEDGGTAHLRPLRRDESGPLLAVFDGLSDTSRASRYLVGASRLPSALLAALTAVDGHDHVAWLATLAGEPAGIARAVRVRPGTVELAFEVVDRHHGRGLGAALLDAVTTVAVGTGATSARASILPDNRPSVRMMRRLGLRVRLVDGLLEAEGPLRLLDPARVDRAAVLALAGVPDGSAPAPAPTPALAPAPAPARAARRGHPAPDTWCAALPGAAH